MSAPASSPKAQLVGTLTVRIHRCADLHKSRLIGKMDPYVKINVGGEEKFKTKVADNAESNPEFNQTFLFNLTGKETDLHLRVYDSEVMTDSWIGRFDMSLYTLLQSGGGSRWENLVDPEQFRKVTGRIEFSASFQGTGGPAATVELAPISGPFHFQHNSTGFLLHASGKEAGATLHLRMGGLNELAHAFEWQGPYVRSLGNKGLYLTAADNDDVSLQSGIGDSAKWKWSGVGVQSVSSNKTLHPRGDQLTAGTQIHLASGANAASGFSLVECKPAAAAAAGAAAAAASASTAAPPTAAFSAMSVEGSWTCGACAFNNSGAAHVCGKCGKPAQGSTAAGGHSIANPAAEQQRSFDLTFPDTWPAHLSVDNHPHVLDKLKEVYQGTYNCDVCKLQGQGIVYHCKACSWDSHPACAHKHQHKK